MIPRSTASARLAPALAPALAAALALAACTAEKPRILSVTIHGDTRDTVGPYAVQTVVAGVTGDDRVNVVYGVRAEGPFIPLRAATLGERDDLFRAAIPGQRAGTTVLYHVSVLRDGEIDPVAEDRPAEGAYWSFRVLDPTGACQVDTDCLVGEEICAGDVCRAFEGPCVEHPSGPQCPDGYRCDEARELCVIAPRTCQTDVDCPSIEQCDSERSECVPRARCADEADCPPGEVCHASLGLCFAP